MHYFLATVYSIFSDFDICIFPQTYENVKFVGASGRKTPVGGHDSVFVCLFVRLNQPVPTAIGSGLLGPQDPFSTTMGDWDLLFI